MLGQLGLGLSCFPSRSESRKRRQVGPVNRSEALCGCFESRVRTSAPAKATSTQLLYVELRELFFQVR